MATLTIHHSENKKHGRKSESKLVMYIPIDQQQKAVKRGFWAWSDRVMLPVCISARPRASVLSL